MNALKLIYRLTSVTIRMNRILLFILLTFSVSIHYFQLPFPNHFVVEDYFRAILFWSWVFAIGYTAQERLTKDGIILTSFKFFYFGILIIVLFSFIEPFISTEEVVEKHYRMFSMTWHYYDFMEISLPLSILQLFVIGFAAKALISAEKKKNVGIGEYLIGYFLIAFAPVGVWFVQPSVQKVLKENEQTLN